jgi:hypothetical protein
MSSSLTVTQALSTPRYNLYTTGAKIKPLYDIGSLWSDVDDVGIRVIMTFLHISGTLPKL